MKDDLDGNETHTESSKPSGKTIPCPSCGDEIALQVHPNVKGGKVAYHACGPKNMNRRVYEYLP